MKPTNRIQWNGSANGAEKQPLIGKSVAKTSVRITDERLFASLTAAAKRDRRTVANFVLVLIKRAQPFWEKKGWDKNYFNDWADGVCLPFSVSPFWRS